jgi:hypothetical protein
MVEEGSCWKHITRFSTVEIHVETLGWTFAPEKRAAGGCQWRAPNHWFPEKIALIRNKLQYGYWADEGDDGRGRKM